jgi:MraZ protein
LEDKIMTLPTTDAYMRRFRRVFIGEAAECNCDKQDRILLPPTLRHYAKLEKEIVLVGALKHFEIWSKEPWETEKLELSSDMLKKEFSTKIDIIGL